MNQPLTDRLAGTAVSQVDLRTLKLVFDFFGSGGAKGNTVSNDEHVSPACGLLSTQSVPPQSSPMVGRLKVAPRLTRTCATRVTRVRQQQPIATRKQGSFLCPDGEASQL